MILIVCEIWHYNYKLGVGRFFGWILVRSCATPCINLYGQTIQLWSLDSMKWWTFTKWMCSLALFLYLRWIDGRCFSHDDSTRTSRMIHGLFSLSCFIERDVVCRHVICGICFFSFCLDVYVQTCFDIL